MVLCYFFLAFNCFIFVYFCEFLLADFISVLLTVFVCKSDSYYIATLPNQLNDEDSVLFLICKFSG